MSLLSRFLGIGRDLESDEPESMQRIAAELEGLEPERARYLAAFAYVLGRMAAADSEVDDAEVETIELALVEIAGIEAGHARLVAEAAHIEAEEEGGTQDYIATRDFRRLASREQRVQLLKCLLQVASADGEITPEESSEILNIAKELGFAFPELKALRADLYKKRNELDRAQSR